MKGRAYFRDDSGRMRDLYGVCLECVISDSCRGRGCQIYPDRVELGGDSWTAIPRWKIAPNHVVRGRFS